MVEVPKEFIEKVYKLVEVVRTDGKLRRGINETTKSIEKGEAKFVVIAEDVNPKEIVMHLPILCQDKNVPFAYVPSKSELGAAAGLPVATASVAVINFGDAKKLFFEVNKELETLKRAGSKAPAKEEKREEETTEPKKETQKLEEPKEGEKPSEKKGAENEQAKAK